MMPTSKRRHRWIVRTWRGDDELVIEQGCLTRKSAEEGAKWVASRHLRYRVTLSHRTGFRKKNSTETLVKEWLPSGPSIGGMALIDWAARLNKPNPDAVLVTMNAEWEAL
jgi:hypothetical protein